MNFRVKYFIYYSISKFIYVVIDNYMIICISTTKFSELKTARLSKGKINVGSSKKGSTHLVHTLIFYRPENYFNIYMGRTFKIFGLECWHDDEINKNVRMVKFIV